MSSQIETHRLPDATAAVVSQIDVLFPLDRYPDLRILLDLALPGRTYPQLSKFMGVSASTVESKMGKIISTAEQRVLNPLGLYRLPHFATDEMPARVLSQGAMSKKLQTTRFLKKYFSDQEHVDQYDSQRRKPAGSNFETGDWIVKRAQSRRFYYFT